ncbi:flavoprotein WrbA [Spirochaeta thermophila DSM 6578]|uniref:Flavoprotein WrbA n=1 Tax=Winmispira thermophila (strain ATCC 700085 / DSM 6578 / Z-1203) TaxID=869211 RepID=G0GET5_WINT7|nr:NAD(P)H:quinone oxidoreductase [Spirochaeta thermophila]AEJ61491.1 flavoprotein WrbA [Spirochaeta thermophila DSM 6578]
MKIYLVYYSTYGHTYKMIQAAAEGVKSEGGDAVIRRVPETVSEEILSQMGALDFYKAQAHVPVATVEELTEADGFIFGSPTRFGNMAAQMKAFLDATGPLWAKGALVDKPAAVITSSSTQHGGQESTILSFHTVLLHHGMILVGLPYTFQGQMERNEISGGSPYGASTIALAGEEGSREPTPNELEGARFLGARLARVARALKG